MVYSHYMMYITLLPLITSLARLILSLSLSLSPALPSPPFALLLYRIYSSMCVCLLDVLAYIRIRP